MLRRTVHSHLGPVRGSAHPLLHPSLLLRPRVLPPLGPRGKFPVRLGPSQSLVPAVSGVCRVKGPMGAFYNHSGKSDPMAGGHP